MSKLKKVDYWTSKNLPTWKECRRVIDNNEYAIKHSIIRVVDEEPLPTNLHYFIYENEPSGIDLTQTFRNALIDVLNEVSHLGEWRGMIFNADPYRETKK